MRLISPKINQLNEIIEWNNNGLLELSPKYQRNSVWNEKAKSYLIDSILRGMPISPIFLRQIIDVQSKLTKREVIDGQQRLRAIIEFIENKFPIHESHNKTYGNKFYEDLEDDDKELILSYEIFVEVVNEKDDQQIYDMFARLNTNNYVLNRQEIRNSKYWGEFKVCVYEFSKKYRNIFSGYGIFKDKQFSRMDDSEFISQLINLSVNGISSDTPNNLDKIYAKYDEKFIERDEVEEKFDRTMDLIQEIYSYLNGNVKCFTSKTYFYTLFAFIYNQLFGLRGCSLARINEFSNENFNFPLLINRIIFFENTFNDCFRNDNTESPYYLQIIQFERLHKTRTTNKPEREIRIAILNDFMINGSL